MHTADIDESPLQGEGPAEMVVRLSLSKAREVARRLGCGWIIASDTIVVFEEEILGKPKDDEEALAMLQRMRGQAHTVYSGLVLCDELTQRASITQATPVSRRSSWPTRSFRTTVSPPPEVPRA